MDTLLKKFKTFKDDLINFEVANTYEEKVKYEKILWMRKNHRTQHLDNQLFFNIKDVKNVFDLFELTRNQKFLKKFFLFNSENKGILLFHGVGVGKTCTALHVADVFEKMFDKPILIMLSHILEDNWKNEIFTKTKFDVTTQKINSCLGNKVLSHNDINIDKKNIDSIAHQYINKKYEFVGYRKLPYLMQKIQHTISLFTKDKSKQKKLYYKKLSELYSDRVIILDEVHNIKDDFKKKLLPTFIKDIMKAAKNVRLVLLSATPMFDDAKEINLLMNLLFLVNRDKHAIEEELDDEEFFVIKNDKLELKHKVKDRLKYFSNNYVSFMRGDNPEEFPLRLEPIISDKNPHLRILKSSDFPKKDIYKSTIPYVEQLKLTTLIECTPEKNGFQEQYLQKHFKVLDKNFKDNISYNGATLSTGLQLSNIIYPSDILSSKTVGQKGFLQHFERKVTTNKRLQFSYKQKTIEKYGYFLDENNLKQYSCKIDMLLRTIRSSEGIVLIYSQYLFSGIIPLCIALEHRGFYKYNNKSILNQDKKKKLGSYIAITGNESLSPNNDDEIRIAKSDENKNGDLIKIILISSTGSEGLDLKNVREIHVLEPWYNINKLEQIYGRGIRKNSHILLDEKIRNTTLYQYANMYRYDVEPIDFRLYRISEIKQQKISLIERVLKENAIDCNFNKDNAYFDPKDRVRTIITSQGQTIKDYEIGDIDYSRLCDYQLCKYKCTPEIDADKKHSDIKIDEYTNIGLFDYDIKLMINKIIHLCSTKLKDKQLFNYDELYDLLKNDHVSPVILQIALYKMIKDEIKFTFDKKLVMLNQTYGKTSNYYIQPLDRALHLGERKSNIEKVSKVLINLYDDDDASDDSGTLEQNNIHDIFKELRMEYDKYADIFKNVLSEKIDDTIIYSMVVDRLSKDKFKILMNFFLGETVSSLIEKTESYIDAATLKCILNGFESGNFIVIRDDEILMYFDHFDKLNAYVKDDDNIMFAPLAKSNKILKDVQESVPIKNDLLDCDGIIDITKNNVTFKIRNEKYVTGSVCANLASLTKQSFIDIIITKYKDVLISKTVLEKMKKPALCTLYEYLIRLKNRCIRYIKYYLFNKFLLKKKK